MCEILPYAVREAIHLSDRVKQTVARGGVVAFPTESYYGLGVNPFDTHAVGKLFRIKGRSEGKPILLLIGEKEQLSWLTETITPAAAILMAAFWPGPLTILFPALPSLPANLTAGSGMIGVRLTSCEPLQAILKWSGPLTGTSANRSGFSPLTTAAAVFDELGAEIDLIIDGGLTPGGPPSTVVDARESVCIIREGAVTRQMLRNVLQTSGIIVL